MVFAVCFSVKHFVKLSHNYNKKTNAIVLESAYDWASLQNKKVFIYVACVKTTQMQIRLRIRAV